MTEARLLPEHAIHSGLRRPADSRIGKQVGDRHSERLGKIPHDVHWGSLPADFDIDDGGSTETNKVPQGLGGEARFLPGRPDLGPEFSAQTPNCPLAEHDAI